MSTTRYDQILTSAAFGLPIARAVSVEALFETLGKSYKGPGKPQSQEFQRALRELEERSVDAAEDARERATQERLAAELSELRQLLAEQQIK